MFFLSIAAIALGGITGEYFFKHGQINGNLQDPKLEVR